MKEPSVLDYVKYRLFPRRYPRVEILEPGEETSLEGRPETETPLVEKPTAVSIANQTPPPLEKLIPKIHWPWPSLLALAFAIFAQFSLRPGPGRTATAGVFLLLIALAYLTWAYYKNEWLPAQVSQPALEPQPASEADPLTIQPIYLFAGISLAIVTFFWGYDPTQPQFSLLNVSLILASLLLTVRAFSLPKPKNTETPMPGRVEKARQILLAAWDALKSLNARNFTRLLLITAAILLVIFFRYTRLAQTPPEMNSDHAEKILDVLRVLNGDADIFFAANGGREALQFYLVAALHKYFRLPLDFTILKLVTITAGFLALPFLYLIGKEVGNPRIGFLAFLLAGVAYWPNVVSRAAMRLPFYMLFTAALLYFLLRGIRTSQRRDFIWAGITLGLSFYGYSADRILPIVVLLALGLYLLHRQSTGKRQFVIIALLALILISLVLFLPLLRYIVANPDAFLYRTLTRMGDLERPLEQPAGIIFLSNLRRALAMFSWDDGEVWVVSIPGHPALGYISGGLFYLGAGLLLLRYLRHRHWLDLFLLLSIPALMLPSIMSLAFPNENPNLYRTGGAFVPVFLMAAIALDSLMTSLTQRVNARFAWSLALVLLGLASIQDYDLVFNRYHEQYLRSAWNTSEMGQVSKDFIASVGSPDSVWVVGYAHWVDTRLVALQAGYPGRDFQIFVDQLPGTLTNPNAKLFILNKQDSAAIEALTNLYPQGWFKQYPAKLPEKEFLLFVAPPINQMPPLTPAATP